MPEERTAEIGGFYLTRRDRSPYWHITWFDASTRQTRRKSTGCVDLRAAEIKLAEHVTLAAQPRLVAPADMPLATVLVRYWHEHAKHVASSATARPSLGLWSEFWGAATIGEITAPRQEAFIRWLKAKGFKNSYVSRVLGVGRAALNRAWKRGEIASTPFIMDERDRSDEEEYYRLSKPEMARLLIAAREAQPHLYTFVMLCLNTLARPGAVLELGPGQVDLSHRRIDMNPAGRKRTKKGRAVVPITDTILPFLRYGLHTFAHPQRTGASKRADPLTGRVPSTYVNWCGKPVLNVRKSFASLVKTSKLPAEVTPYSLRHTMATEMRARGVPWEEIQGWLGHSMKGVTEKYARFSPDYLGQGARAIDSYLAELGVPLP